MTSQYLCVASQVHRFGFLAYRVYCIFCLDGSAGVALSYFECEWKKHPSNRRLREVSSPNRFKMIHSDGRELLHNSLFGTGFVLVLDQFFVHLSMTQFAYFNNTWRRSQGEVGTQFWTRLGRHDKDPGPTGKNILSPFRITSPNAHPRTSFTRLPFIKCKHGIQDICDIA
jgi:hypothetical protein